MDSKSYLKLVEKQTPSSPGLKNCLLAFLVGGAICTLGQALGALYRMWGVEKEVSSTLISCSLVFLGALFTGLGVYAQLAKHPGAGPIVPITGFANSIVSPAMEFRSEGLVLGMGAKMFVVAGPVLVYGITASVLYGLIYWLVGVLS